MKPFSDYQKDELLHYIEGIKMKTETPLKQGGVEYSLLLKISSNLFQLIDPGFPLICKMPISIQYDLNNYLEIVVTQFD